MIKKLQILILISLTITKINSLRIPYLSLYTIKLKNDMNCSLDVWKNNKKNRSPIISLYQKGEITFKCRRNFFLYLSFGFYNKLNGTYKVSWKKWLHSSEFKISEIVYPKHTKINIEKLN